MLDNKYTKTYFRLMNHAMLRHQPDGYVERHHVIPRSLGGSDEPENVVVLTAREHYIAHLLLTKMTTGIDKRKMSFALLCFNRRNPNHPGRTLPKSKLYAYSRKLLSETSVDPETAAKISRANKGKRRSPEHIEAIRRTHTGKLVSTETRAKMSAAKKGKTGRKWSDSSKAKLSAANRGRKLSQEVREKGARARKASKKWRSHIESLNVAKRKPCTVDGITIYESRAALIAALGKGRNGMRSPTFRYVEI